MKLNDTQRPWSTIEREAFATLSCLQKYRSWLFGSKVTIHSDHNPLLYLTESVPKSSRLMRWALALQEYNVAFKYRYGRTDTAADFLSRVDYGSPGNTRLRGGFQGKVFNPLGPCPSWSHCCNSNNFMFVFVCFVYVQRRDPVIWWINIQLFQHLADASNIARIGIYNMVNGVVNSGCCDVSTNSAAVLRKNSFDDFVFDTDISNVGLPWHLGIDTPDII